MFERIMEDAGGMTPSQLRQAIEVLKVMVLQALRGPEGEPETCPRCGEAHIVRKGVQRPSGKVTEPTQRWQCTACRRTFNKRTLGVLTQSKLKAWQWVRYVELMCRHAPLSECAESCGVSDPTAQFMRVRICQVMALATPAFTCAEGERVEVDGTYLNENLKDMAWAPLPREAHRSGHDVREPGISNLKIAVLCGVSASGRVFVEVCDRGRPTDKAISAVLEGKVEGAAVVTDDHKGYARVLPGLGVGSHEAHRGGGEELGRVNALHERLKSFLRPFNGVSTRRLRLYAAWFRFEEWVRRAGADRLQEMFSLLATGRYRLTRRMLAAEERPFWDHWEGRYPEVDAVSLWGEEAM